MTNPPLPQVSNDDLLQGLRLGGVPFETQSDLLQGLKLSGPTEPVQSETGFFGWLGNISKNWWHVAQAQKKITDLASQGVLSLGANDVITGYAPGVDPSKLFTPDEQSLIGEMQKGKSVNVKHDLWNDYKNFFGKIFEDKPPAEHQEGSGLTLSSLARGVVQPLKDVADVSYGVNLENKKALTPLEKTEATKRTVALGLATAATLGVGSALTAEALYGTQVVGGLAPAVEAVNAGRVGAFAAKVAARATAAGAGGFAYGLAEQANQPGQFKTAVTDGLMFATLGEGIDLAFGGVKAGVKGTKRLLSAGADKLGFEAVPTPVTAGQVSQIKQIQDIPNMTLQEVHNISESLKTADDLALAIIDGKIQTDWNSLFHVSGLTPEGLMEAGEMLAVDQGRGAMSGFKIAHRKLADGTADVLIYSDIYDPHIDPVFFSENGVIKNQIVSVNGHGEYLVVDGDGSKITLQSTLGTEPQIKVPKEDIRQPLRTDIAKPFGNEVINWQARAAELGRAADQAIGERNIARRAAETDPGTGLGNKAAKEKAMASLKPGEKAISFDINNMGLANKVLGNESFVDAVLVDFANTLRSVAQEMQLPERLFRHGGDEFSAIVPADKAEAFITAVENKFGRIKYDSATPEISVSGAHGDNWGEASSKIQGVKQQAKSGLQSEIERRTFRDFQDPATHADLYEAETEAHFERERKLKFAEKMQDRLEEKHNTTSSEVFRFRSVTRDDIIDHLYNEWQNKVIQDNVPDAELELQAQIRERGDDDKYKRKVIEQNKRHIEKLNKDFQDYSRRIDELSSDEAEYFDEIDQNIRYYENEIIRLENSLDVGSELDAQLAIIRYPLDAQKKLAELNKDVHEIQTELVKLRDAELEARIKAQGLTEDFEDRRPTDVSRGDIIPTKFIPPENKPFDPNSYGDEVSPEPAQDAIKEWNKAKFDLHNKEAELQAFYDEINFISDALELREISGVRDIIDEYNAYTRESDIVDSTGEPVGLASIKQRLKRELRLHQTHRPYTIPEVPGSIVNTEFIPGFDLLTPMKQFFKDRGFSSSEIPGLLRDFEKRMADEAISQLPVKEQEFILKQKELLRAGMEGKSDAVLTANVRYKPAERSVELKELYERIDHLDELLLSSKQARSAVINDESLSEAQIRAKLEELDKLDENYEQERSNLRHAVAAGRGDLIVNSPKLAQDIAQLQREINEAQALIKWYSSRKQAGIETTIMDGVEYSMDELINIYEQNKRHSQSVINSLTRSVKDVTATSSDVADAAAGNGYKFVDKNTGYYELLDESNRVIKTSESLEEIHQFINDSKQTSGTALDSQGPPAEQIELSSHIENLRDALSDPTLPPGERAFLAEQLQQTEAAHAIQVIQAQLEGTPISGEAGSGGMGLPPSVGKVLVDDGGYGHKFAQGAAKLLTFIDNFPLFTRIREYALKLDTDFGVDIHNNVVEPIKNARKAANAAMRPTLEKLKDLNEQKGIRDLTKRQREQISEIMQTMSPEEVASSYMSRPMNAMELTSAQRLLELGTFNIENTFKYRRGLIDLKERYKLEDPTQREAFELKRAELQKEFNIGDNELKATDIIDTITSFDRADISLGAVVRYVRSVVNKEVTSSALAARYKATPGMMAAVEGLRTMYRELAETFSIPQAQRLNQFMTHARLYADGDIYQAMRLFGPEKAEREFYAKLARTGELAVYELDPFIAMQRYIKAGYDAQIGMNKAISDAQNALRENVKKLPHAAQEQALRVMNSYIDEMRGVPGAGQQATQNAVDRLTSALGFKHNINVRKSVVNSILSVIPSATQGARIMAGIRDYSTSNVFYQARFGLKRAARMNELGAKAWKGIEADALKEAGIINEASPVTVADATELTGTRLGNARGATLRTYDKVSDTLFRLSGQKDIYTLLHAGMYLEGRETALKGIDRYVSRMRDVSKEKFEAENSAALRKLIKETQLDSYDAPIQNKFLELVQQGKNEEAARYLGLQTAYDQLQIVGLGEHPYLWNTNAGKMLGQFGNYAMFVRSNITRMASRGTIGARIARMARLSAGSWAVYFAGKELGLDLSNWGISKSIAFAGGPMADLARTVNDAIGGVGPNQKQAISKLGRMVPFYNPVTGQAQVKSLFLPGSYAVEGIINAIIENDATGDLSRSLPLGLGFRLLPPGQD